MYNCRVFKYASGGYQVRLYSQPVGVTNVKEVDMTDASMAADLYWVKDKEIGDYVLSNNPYGVPFEELMLNPFEEDHPERITEYNADKDAHSKQVSRSRTINRLYYLTRSNVWDWFVTLTFAPDRVDRYDYTACSKKLHEWLRNCKRSAPNMRYIVVPEYHKDGAFHFHGLFADCQGLRFEDSGKKASGQPIYNIGAYKLGWTTATRVQSSERVSKYLTKYITKELCAVTSGKKRFWASRNLDEAETMDFILEPGDRDAFIADLSPYIQHAKTIEGGEIKTSYLELSEGVEVDFNVLCLDS